MKQNLLIALICIGLLGLQPNLSLAEADTPNAVGTPKAIVEEMDAGSFHVVPFSV